MTNDRLRDALTTAGLTPQDLADRLEVDPKTAERWLTLGRTPYPKHRHQIAALLQERESYLWPDALSQSQRDRIAQSEIVHVYPRRSALPSELWPRLFDGAKAYVDILVYAGLFLPEQYPELVTAFCEKAEAGVRHRLLLGDPASGPVATRGAEERIGDAVAAKIHNVVSFYRPHAEHGCIEARFHSTTLYNSIYRFDDDMLVNTHIYGRPAAQAPVMHLRRLSAGDLFDTYADAFDTIWAAATPWSESKITAA
jgi:hypothetical protein